MIRNMYYVGYTSVISGGEDMRIFEYADWCYGAEEDEEEVSEYDLGYFFSEGGEEEYVITAPSDQVYRQLFAQYPTQEAISRSSIMVCFDEDQTREINQMWINGAAISTIYRYGCGYSQELRSVCWLYLA